MPASDDDLDGKVAVITGASSGIGQATAERLAGEGMDVALAARRLDRLEKIAGDLRSKHDVEVLPLEVDVREWPSVQEMAAAVEETFGGADLVFANAGTGGGAFVEDMPVATWEKVIETNLSGAFHTAKATIPLLEDRPGTRTLVFTASVSGTMGMAGSSAYCASKWGLRGFAQSLALEVSGQGIRVTSINPGFVNTRWHEGHPRAEEMIQPEDLGDLVAYLATMPETALLDDVTVWPAKMYDA